ncbi:MAG: VCBS repeat-containing protein [Acidobacteriales bacterium]|nr:VCBS repeat-containing protein [Terriglobales bacterium]
MKVHTWSAALLVSAFLFTTHFTSAQRFIRAPRYSAGKEPTLAVVTADFNGDGKPDLAFATDDGAADVNVRLGNGDGTFGPDLQSGSIEKATSIVAGDWDGDGITDLAVTNSGANAVAILVGHGDGIFAEIHEYAVPSGPVAITTGDLNGDGVADLVIAHQSGETGSVSVLRGLGGGNFSIPTTYPVLGVATDVGVADFDGDGKLDVVETCYDVFEGTGNIGLLRGNGDGTLRTGGYFETTAVPNNLVVADFNHDGKLDVAAAGIYVAVSFGTGTGTFGTAQLYPVPSVAIATADLNGDGNLDLVTTDSLGANVAAVFLGNADGTFKNASLFGTGQCPVALAVADYNADAHLDLAVPEDCDTSFALLLGDGTGKFVTRRDFAVAGGLQFPHPISVAAGYLDSDTSLDLVVADDVNNQVILLPGNKSGAFRSGPHYPTQNSPHSVAVTDLNSDGKSDVVTANGRSNTISVLIGNGNGTLQSHIEYNTCSDPEYIATADLNGDSKVDLITANTAGNSFSVLLNDGTGKFPAHIEHAVTSPLQIALADFSGDGKLDLVTASSSGAAGVFIGKDDGTFVKGEALSVAGQAVALAVGDLNKDGRVDVAVASSSGILYTFLGNGNGTFGSPLTTAISSSPHAVLLGDFDGDGSLDAVVLGGSLNSSTASLLPGKGDGTFRQAQLYVVGYAPTAGAVGDFNSDGALDVVTANNFVSTISVLLNTGNR